MFVLVVMSVISLGALVFTLRWTLSPPHGAFDGTIRVLVATAVGGMIAFWVVAASMAPQLNDTARQQATALVAPTPENLRTLAEDILASAPIGVDIAAGIGAGLGFFIALASVGSYRRAT